MGVSLIDDRIIDWKPASTICHYYALRFPVKKIVCAITSTGQQLTTGKFKRSLAVKVAKFRRRFPPITLILNVYRH